MDLSTYNYLKKYLGEGTTADQYYKAILNKILEEGCKDKDPRPHWEDVFYNATYDKKERTIITSDKKEIMLNDKESVKIINDNTVILITPAYTISINDFGSCKYNLAKGEIPMSTLKPAPIRTAVAEILWIWQKETTDLVTFDDLLSTKRKQVRTWVDGKDQCEITQEIHNWWKEWALRDKNNSYLLNENNHPYIGQTYGKINFDHKLFQNYVYNDIINNPDSRYHGANLFQMEDFKKPHGLKPCVYENRWFVRHGNDKIDYLDMFVNQRSWDYIKASDANQIQYCALLCMVAKDLGYVPGYFMYQAQNIQIYDRFKDIAEDLLARKPLFNDSDFEIKVLDESILEPRLERLNNHDEYKKDDKYNFYNMTPDSFKIEGPIDKETNETYQQKIKRINPMPNLPIAI